MIYLFIALYLLAMPLVCLVVDAAIHLGVSKISSPKTVKVVVCLLWPLLSLILIAVPPKRKPKCKK